MNSHDDARIPLEPNYEDAFVRHAHQLVGLGHARLVPVDLATLDEPAITGHLVDAMEAALDAPDRPDWATHLTTIDDQPLSVGGATGNRRPRVDVTVRCTNLRPAISYRFEAKRLHSDRSLTEYLGEEGLLSLVTAYYGDIRRAGMLGYVQSETCSAWSARIKNAITDDPSRYHARTPVRFPSLAVSLPEPPFSSEHEYGQPLQERTITHTLLACA